MIFGEGLGEGGGKGIPPFSYDTLWLHTIARRVKSGTQQL